MAFQSYEELINMASSNPKRATALVNRAQQKGIPVVSKNNPGYGDNSDNPSSDRTAALKRRMMTMKTAMQQESQSDQIVNARKQIGY